MILDDPHRRIVSANEFNRIVYRAVIRDYDLEIDMMRTLMDRTQAVPYHPQVIPTDNYDRKFHNPAAVIGFSHLYFCNPAFVLEGIVGGFEHAHNAQASFAIIERALVISYAIEEVRGFNL